MRKAFLAFILSASVFFPVFAKADKKISPAGVPETTESVIAEKTVIPYFLSLEDGQQPELRDLKVDIEFLGNAAMTSYDMVFYNPGGTVAEGVLFVPLAENQSIAALAFDAVGKMRDGAVVEKRKENRVSEPDANAQAGFSAHAKVPDGHFCAGGFSFDPGKTRRIRVTVEEFMPSKENGYVYDIFLSAGKKINFDLSAEIPSSMTDGFPSVKSDFADFVFKKGNNVLKASFSQKDYFLNGALSLITAKPRQEPVFTHKNGKRTYFYADINVNPASKSKIFPKIVALFWDVSFSAGKRNIERELALLDSYFKKLSDAEVEFSAFNMKARPPKKYSVKKGVWADLKKDISRIVYDGGTRFDNLNLSGVKADEILLFTDGINSFGSSGIPVGSVPVVVVNSCAEFNCGALAAAAAKSGGTFIDLNSVSDKKAAELICEQKLKLVSYSFDKNKIKELFPKEGSPVDKDFVLAGALDAPESEIILSFGYDKNNILYSKKVKIRAGGDNPAVERLWAAQKIKALELDGGAKSAAEILRLGKKYSIVTGQTSFAALKTAADYLAYKVKPPQELADEYGKLEALQKRNAKNKREAALEDAVLQAQDIKDWWKHDYKSDKNAARQAHKETAFGVKPSRIFGTGIPAASEGEVKAPEAGNALNGFFADKVKEKESFSAAGFDILKTESSKEKGENFSAGQIKARDPGAPYMKIIKNSFDDEIYSDYLKLKAGYGDSPSFYFDIADELISREMKDEAVAVLSNIAEMNAGSAELLRAVAYKFMEAQRYSCAVDVFEKIVKIKEKDPQSYRDLALAYQANKENKKALNAFYKILTGNWDRFQSIKQIAFVEMNNLISLHPGMDLSGIDRRLIFSMPVDVRIVLGWSADDTDIDIYIKEPSGEQASYGNRFTGSGGRVSEDLTQGFGPEEYMIKRAENGKYEISTDFYGDDKRPISGPTALYLDIYTFYGTKKQVYKRSIIRTDDVKENGIIGTLDFKKPAK